MPTLAALRSLGDAVVDGLLAENAGRWEIGVGARSRARRGARAGGGQPPAARADAAGQGAGRRGSPRPPGSCCASCSAWRSRPRPERPTAEVRRLRGLERAAARDPRQRARSRPGAVGRRRCSPSPPELVTITTAGDVDRARGDKSRWVGALEAALLAGEIDLAVHSAKDVPGELAPGTAIVATPRRATPLDALVGDAAASWRWRPRRDERAPAARAAAGRPARPGGRRAARQRGHAAAQARGRRGRRARARRRRARAAGAGGRRCAGRRRVRAGAPDRA